MKNEKSEFYNNYKKNKEILNPIEDWIQNNKFPYTLISCIIIVLCTSIQVYFNTTNTFDYSRQFIRNLNYNMLQHIYFDFYFAGTQNYNIPYQEYYTIEDFLDILDNMQTYLGHLNQSIYQMVDQDNLNTTIQSLNIFYNNGTPITYSWTIQDGITDPFDMTDPESFKNSINKIEYMQLALQNIQLGGINKKNIWSIRIHIEVYSHTSLIVTLIAYQKLSTFYSHIPTLICAILLIPILFKMVLQQKKEIFQWLLFFFLLLSSICSISQQFTTTNQLIMDGITCLLAWLWILKILPQRDVYHVSLLLSKSYLLVGRLFISFFPLFMGFAILAYCLFCRYAHQFSSFKQTVLSLFYICYYNMAYQQMVVTERANPLSTIFFIVFIVLFTFCVYSSLLVSVFCSFAWDRRQQQMKQEILKNLKIQCSACQFKYKYDQKLLLNRSQSKSQFDDGLVLDEQKRFKLRQLYRYRILNNTKKIQIIINELKLYYEDQLKFIQKKKVRYMNELLLNFYKEKYNMNQVLILNLQKRMNMDQNK